MTERIYLYDSSLRDGAQTRGIDFSATDKQSIARQLDAIGIDYIEGGWPGANPTDDAFFQNPPEMKKAKLAAFGMTRRPGRSAENDPGLAALVNTGVKAACIVGKTWDFQVDTALEIPREENIAMIAESLGYLAGRLDEPMFDAEHFFDGYRRNPDYALACIKAAYESGARWIVLCDTNGGTLPDEVERIVSEVAKHIPGERLGIHCHNDTENAVANSLAAVRAGVRQVQGTINGIGERCGNANLTSIIPTLMLKMGFETGIDEVGLRNLTHFAHAFDDHDNRVPNPHAPYVGKAAFAHKGGLHVSAVAKCPECYEHIDPALVGNAREIIISDQAGRANILMRLEAFASDLQADSAAVQALVDEVKDRENMGYAYEAADASFELLARRHLSSVPDYYQLQNFRVIDERRWNAKGELVTLSEATAKLKVGGERMMTVAEGNGPVNALDKALRKALSPFYPVVEGMKLVDYKVRILTPGEGTRAVTRVLIESENAGGRRWTTLGVSANIIDASYNALHDSLTYAIFHAGE